MENNLNLESLIPKENNKPYPADWCGVERLHGQAQRNADKNYRACNDWEQFRPFARTWLQLVPEAAFFVEVVQLHTEERNWKHRKMVADNLPADATEKLNAALAEYFKAVNSAKMRGIAKKYGNRAA